MSINETEYRMDIEGLQSAMEKLCPTAVLIITSRGPALSVSSESTLRDGRSIAKVLDAATEQFYNEGGI